VEAVLIGFKDQGHNMVVVMVSS